MTKKLVRIKILMFLIRINILEEISRRFEEKDLRDHTYLLKRTILFKKHVEPKLRDYFAKEEIPMAFEKYGLVPTRVVVFFFGSLS